ncbi:MAG: helix-turn-helix domain-containing protein [Austwickia sp.]|nr:helix-turn-helix domain-containing protein [Actinomycetota bacterium]MCB1254961.1 helix-turn-helix transcriptional regulator [Austwickia sp.]MCO5308128.1 helix-turn-helix domain-containing protein [Austwickia sp.]
MTANIEMGAVWMILVDRKRLLRLMAIQGVSQRQLAKAAGWRSHAYLGRLMRGQANTLEPEPAVRIAAALQVGTDDLFMARTTASACRSASRQGSAA